MYRRYGVLACQPLRGKEKNRVASEVTCYIGRVPTVCGDRQAIGVYGQLPMVYGLMFQRAAGQAIQSPGSRGEGYMSDQSYP